MPVRFAVSLCAAAFLAAGAASADEFREKAVDSGLALELTLTPTASASLREGDPISVGVALTDSATGAPMNGIRPALWLARRSGDPVRDQRPCAAKIADFLSGSMFTAADVDLNTFYVVTLNGDGTIGVVDPRFSFGGSRLLALLQLPTPGYDWAFSEKDQRLLVTMPESNRIAVIDTTSWTLIGQIDAGPRPSRIATQPDGARIWVTSDGPGEVPSGVAILDPRTGGVLARIVTGRGPHRIVLTDDNAYAVVTNERDGSASIIDARRLVRIATLPIGQRPQSVAFSRLGNFVAVASENGPLTIIRPAARKIIARVATELGASQVQFTPDSRYAFVLNRSKNIIQIVDATTLRVVQTADIAGGPEQLEFSDTIAYVRQLRSEQVLMIPYASIGREHAPVNIADFPGGQHPFGQASRTVAAAGMFRAPGENAMLVANPADREIYYYKEGMAAPMGQFSNDSREPLAVMALDRSLRQRAPGKFHSEARLPRAGHYDLAVLVDAPRVVACFEVMVGEDPALAAQRQVGAVRVEHLSERVIPVAKRSEVRFRLIDPRTRAARKGLHDVRALIYLAPGVWHTRVAAEPLEDGTYTLDVIPPRPGVYYVHIESSALGLPVNNPQYVVLRAD